MKTALISDVHANLEALEAVLQAVDQRGADRILCLGDVVGYGGSPNECLNLIRKRCQLVLLGNHDSAASGGPEISRFNPNAKAAALWTSKVLTSQNRDYLRALTLSQRREPYLFVHASPAAPRDWEYIFDRFDAEPQFQFFTERACFIGHTHQPAIFERTVTGCESLPPTTLRFDPLYRYIVNVGSVGQPRDHDPRACFVLLEEPAASIDFVRVPYDIEAAQEKIRLQNLPPVLAARLASGE
ncbi:MAG: metallophosphoesterase family protein [Candidatus Eisenbacteria bacterium]|uniref:Metallophosphoesterase family protein n=1 Tax=Eiseniibacteriota bacterium TaxID=2212470 RepID=A0A538TBE5_UNCEI|nr:MAG: metallophosphoesterase family protein [Candidatus Eisenbacteria bacterium]